MIVSYVGATLVVAQHTDLQYLGQPQGLPLQKIAKKKHDRSHALN